MHIGIEGLHKRFGPVPALCGVDLTVASGQLLAVLGPSGSGKTTLLRMLAGLESADAGSIRFDGRDATGLSLRERRVGLVFQHYALFPHLSVFDNIAFGLRVRPRRERPSPAEVTRRVDELLDCVQMSSLRDRLPSQLSGGQMQRVALARAMAIEPSVLLLDEPFGALDAKVRADLRRWLRKIHEQTGYTTVLVTHDQDEALELADRVVVLCEGRIVQDGAPDAVYADPASAFVFDFIGRSSFLRGCVRSGRFHVDGCTNSFPCDRIADGPGRLFVRPQNLVRSPTDDGLLVRVLGARVREGRQVLALELPGQSQDLEMDLPDDAPQQLPAIGELIRVHPQRFRVYPDSDARD